MIFFYAAAAAVPAKDEQGGEGRASH